MKNYTFEKIIIAPQIVVYKNIFKKSKDMIDMLNDKNCIIGEWYEWFEQGFRKEVFQWDNRISESDSENVVYQKQIIQEFLDILNFIRNDYLSEFNLTNSIWPNFINDWDKMLKEPGYYDLDFFKWSNDKIKNKNLNLGEVMMPYHVDDWYHEKDYSTKKLIATLNIYLNDNYEGGEICAYDSISNKSYVYKPGEGDLVIMPSHSPFYHAVKFFKGSDRYFMRSFFKYEYIGTNSEEVDVLKEIKKYVDKDLQQISVDAEEIIIS